ncbi:52 kDa repressor of the inhibitor of the protein kinase [Cyphomyrmex costatus]|uniref:52 kDa repressor of the inhibitor of the protein kinase n=1 Tax=Cyphomyrmex costatus TaxID=456900 RepID=A0A151IHW3_9HYME|nr:52 kDa repressor of the inhibitor of the protein kinase [Cyphomyrmex costatus]
MKRGGYSCTMNNCSNISGRERNISFFYFPKDPDRAKLWLEKCNRKINTTPENLHKNYKVCGNHFKSSMFLNDLKNRLQPHAIPEPMRNDNESSVNDATFNLNDKSEENTSISDNNNHLINNVYEEDHVESVFMYNISTLKQSQRFPIIPRAKIF